MPITRSMSGATKKVEKVPDGPKQKSKPKQKSNPKQNSGIRPYTIKDEAFNVFMVKDYVKRYYETHPFSVFFPMEAAEGGYLEWANMTDADKDKWIEYTKKRHAEGASVWTIRLECLPTYNCN
ncbi:hypothetical protein OROMI_019217 [Orobanche minor]